MQQRLVSADTQHQQNVQNTAAQHMVEQKQNLQNNGNNDTLDIFSYNFDLHKRSTS